MNLEEYESIGTHWIALHVDKNNITYFDSFRVKHIPKEIKKFTGNKDIITNVYRIQAYDPTMCEYFCIGFIDFMLKHQSLLVYSNLFSPNEYELISRTCKKVCTTLSCIERFLILASTITGFI